MATAARERFLSQASVSLQDSTFSLAQQLRLSLISLQDTTGGANRAKSSECCPVCGSLNVNLQTVKVLKTKRNSHSPPDIATKRETSRVDIYKCQTCFRSRKVPAKEPKPVPIQRSNVTVSDTSVGERDVSKDRDSKVQKTSSKKRAKERKEREGLQALLSKKPDNARPTNSFDLMDFMSHRS